MYHLSEEKDVESKLYWQKQTCVRRTRVKQNSLYFTAALSFNVVRAVFFLHTCFFLRRYIRVSHLTLYVRLDRKKERNW